MHTLRKKLGNIVGLLHEILNAKHDMPQIENILKKLIKKVFDEAKNL